MSTVVAGADQYYSDDVREKVIRAHDDRRAAGLPATGWPGFGHVRACGCSIRLVTFGHRPCLQTSHIVFRPSDHEPLLEDVYLGA